MTESERPVDGFSLRRWSQRKRAAARSAEASPPMPVTVAAATALPVPLAATEAGQVANSALPQPAIAAAELPAVETLSFESDFSAFLQPKVEESLRRQALKKLFADPRFNVMDGLDVYIDDYGKPDPISPELVRQLVQGRYLFDPPRTRVNAEGVVEDVPPDDAEAPPPAEETVAAVVASPAESTLASGPPTESAFATPPAEAPGAPAIVPAAESRS